MIELGDRSLKEGQDVVDAILVDGWKAHDIHRVCGEAVSGLIADACDILAARLRAGIKRGTDICQCDEFQIRRGHYEHCPFAVPRI